MTEVFNEILNLVGKDNCEVFNSYYGNKEAINIFICGDWKHDHIYICHKVTNWLCENGYKFDIANHTTEENGSDWYSAEHFYYNIRKVGAR